MGEAMRLASHPMFSGSIKGFRGKPKQQLHDVKLTPQGKSFTFSARITADPPIYGVVGYTDPVGGSNYDATTYTAVPDADGRFSFECNALAPGKAGELRIVAFQVNGAKNSDASPQNDPTFPYSVEADGTVDLTASLAREQLGPVIVAVNTLQAEVAKRELQKLETAGATPRVANIGRQLLATLDRANAIAPADADGERLPLSAAVTKTASVGYGSPVANRLPGDNALLMVASRLYLTGLYAHAPARHTWELGGKWGRLQGKAGVADGHDGTVVFNIMADGRELWHSRLLKNGETATYDVPVKDVKTLELLVSDGGDGNRGDWGVWLEPTLLR
jgi:hypothetical protein